MNTHKNLTLSHDLRFGALVSLVFFLRMFSLFMVLPIMVLASEEFSMSTPKLIGLAIGIYGLTQALLQIPLGTLSDRFGRKPIIAIGLLVFIIGSIIAALSSSIYGLILGRALQGAGAITATIIAFISDHCSSKHRSKVMAIIGSSIGLAFALAFILGPLLYESIYLRGLLLLGAGLGLLAIVILYGLLPSDKPIITTHKIPFQQILKTIFANKTLIKLNISIFISHMILIANFMVIPIYINDYANTQSWFVYLIALICSTPIVVLLLINEQNKFCLIGAVAMILLAEFSLLFWHYSTLHIIISLTIFFSGFNFLEAWLPSTVSKVAGESTKGAVLGVYSTAQFMGIFFGGILGGYLQTLAPHAIILFCLIISGIWLIIIAYQPNPSSKNTL